MDTKTKRKISRGGLLWNAPRMKPVVKRLGTKNIKKQPAKKK
jgi:hypothetical protein